MLCGCVEVFLLAQSPSCVVHTIDGLPGMEYRAAVAVLRIRIPVFPFIAFFVC